MDQRDIKLKIDNEKSIKTIQSVVRGWKVRKIKRVVNKVLNNPDTIKLLPSRFNLPLFIVQRTLFEYLFGKKHWERYKFLLSNNFYLITIFLFWFFSITMSCLSLFEINHYIFNYISILLAFPLYISLYLSLQQQILLLVISSLDCKIYLSLTLLFCIFSSDLFRDLRIINIWLNLFPSMLIIPLADAIPRYLKKLRKIFMTISLIFVIYGCIYIIGLSLYWIKYNKRDITFDSNITKKNSTETIVTYLNNVSYTISLLHTLIILVLKNIIWYFCNSKRAIILKSSILITNINKHKSEKMDDAYVMKNKSINQLKVPFYYPFIRNT